MEKTKQITAEDCAGLRPRMFVVNHAAGERLNDAVRQWLVPIDNGSVRYWNLKKDNETALHYHDFDEYWLWSHGRTELTIRLPNGDSDTFDIGPGWVVYCVRGVEHGHVPCEDWGCYEFVGVKAPDIGSDHLFRNFV